jgi:GntR family transcriptional regulator
MIPINPRSGVPIYEQVKDGLRTVIVTGALQPDERLPSVRELAAQLSINPNTIQRAYRELEQEGYIYTAAGRGAFCADWRAAADERCTQLLAQMESLVSELERLGMTRSEILAKLSKEEATHD